jgi:endonuclease/exonuclease/phosphatase family metal-dependent hydrolase
MVVIDTWNLENLFRPGGDGPPNQDAYGTKLKALGNTIVDVAPNVLAVQEIGQPDTLDELAAVLGGDWHIAVSRYPDSRQIRVGFLSRHPLSNVRNAVAFPARLEPVQVGDAPTALSRRMGRGALVVTVEPTAGFIVTRITCHLKSKLLSFPGDRFNTDDEDERARYATYALHRRAAEAATVRSLATKQLAPAADRRVIVLGDLNDETKAATTQILLGPPCSEIGTAGFGQRDNGDRWRLWNLAPLIPAAQRYSRITRGRKELIDHILVSHALLDPEPTVRSVVDQGLPSVTEDPRAHRDAAASDHASIVATFDVQRSTRRSNETRDPHALSPDEPRPRRSTPRPLHP